MNAQNHRVAHCAWLQCKIKEYGVLKISIKLFSLVSYTIKACAYECVFGSL